MSKLLVAGRLAGLAVVLTLSCFARPQAAQAVSTTAASCPAQLSSGIPKPGRAKQGGSTIMETLGNAWGQKRDAVVVEQVLAGNVPAFLRQLTPVNMAGTRADGSDVQVTICVTPEYLSVGNDDDFVRVPMGLPAAARIADATGFLLPTTRMVDAIYQQAPVRLTPSPMKPTAQMESTSYLLEHNRTLAAQKAKTGKPETELAAGQKKDIVLSNRLISKPGRVAIYGWHRPNGKPIQPLSTVHGAAYADYSHGVRLVSRMAYVDGQPRDLVEIMQDRELAGIVSSEGPIREANRLLASLY